MMAQIAELQEQMAAEQAEIAEEQGTETAGGGEVAVTMTGDQKCTAVRIEEDVLKDGDAEMLQYLLLAAINKALDSTRALSEEKMAPFANLLGGMGMGR